MDGCHPRRGAQIEIKVTNFIVEPSNIDGESLKLIGEEAKHLQSVLRGKTGDIFFAIDGLGVKYRAIVESLTKTHVIGKIISSTRRENEPYYEITLAQGICRQNKIDDIIDKGTELGVTSFIIYYSDKSYSKINDDKSAGAKLNRLNRIARAAAKQSKRSVIPTISIVLSFNDTLKFATEHDISLIAALHPESRMIKDYLHKSIDAKKILLLVGPESGLSDEEVESAVRSGFKPISLGPRRLRTETAGILFPALALSYLGDI